MLWVFQELNDLFQLLFRPVSTRYVVEGRFFFALVKELRLAFAYREQPLPLRLHAPQENVSDDKQNNDRQQPDDDQPPREVAFRLGHDLDTRFFHLFHEPIVAKRWHVGHELLILRRVALCGRSHCAFFQRSAHFIAHDFYAFDVARTKLRAKLAIANFGAHGTPATKVAPGQEQPQPNSYNKCDRAKRRAASIVTRSFFIRRFLLIGAIGTRLVSGRVARG